MSSGQESGTSRSFGLPILVAALAVAIVIAVGATLYYFRPPTQLDSNLLVDESLPHLTSLQLPPIQGSLLEQHATIDAEDSDWDSEAFHEKIVRQLHLLGEHLQGQVEIKSVELSFLVDADFRCSSLRTATAEDRFDDTLFTISRSSTPLPLNSRKGRGPEALRAALEGWLSPYGDLKQVRLDTKVSHVELNLESDDAFTIVHVTLSGIADAEPFQENTTWDCRWTRPTDDSLPRLLEIKLNGAESVRLTSGVRLFSDNTESVLGKNRCFGAQFSYGATHWCHRLVARMGVYLRSLHGLAIADVNGDGLDDLYICEPGGLPNRLFLQNADGTAKDASEQSGIDLLEPTRAAIIADFDNDGHQDIALSMIYSAIAFFRGHGDGKFQLVEAIPVRGKAYSLAAADYDGDGLLDLYACLYNDVAGEIGESGSGIPEPYYDANQGAANVLLRNVGSLRFADVTENSGLNVNNRRFSYAAAWEDFDNDGDQDLYVANDFGRNNLYRNDGERFADIAPSVGVEDIASGMGVTWADYDNDGLMDFYVSNMWSSAGSRITFQRKFPAKDQSTRDLFKRLARGNSMFRNQGAGRFEDTSFSASVTMGRWAWGSKFIDLNNDGFEDLVVANGFVTGEKSQDL